jgi:hypothetical protein
MKKGLNVSALEAMPYRRKKSRRFMSGEHNIRVSFLLSIGKRLETRSKSYKY